MKRTLFTFLTAALLLTGCRSGFDSFGDDGADTEMVDTGFDETGTSDGESGSEDAGSGSETGTSETTGDETTGDETGGPVELGPDEPCDPLLEADGVEVCSAGFSCWPTTNDYDTWTCKPVIDNHENGTAMGSHCEELPPPNVTTCMHSACTADLNAQVDIGQMGEETVIHTQAWLDFCGDEPDPQAGPEFSPKCCVPFCDVVNPNCFGGDPAWECMPASQGSPFGLCVPKAEG